MPQAFPKLRPRVLVRSSDARWFPRRSAGARSATLPPPDPPTGGHLSAQRLKLVPNLSKSFILHVSPDAPPQTPKYWFSPVPSLILLFRPKLLSPPHLSHTPSRPIPSLPIPSRPISPHLAPSCLSSPHLTSLRLYLSHPVSTHPILLHSISPYPVFNCTVRSVRGTRPSRSPLRFAPDLHVAIGEGDEARAAGSDFGRDSISAEEISACCVNVIHGLRNA